VEFTIHSAMLIGGPKALQEGLFPGGVRSPPSDISIHAQIES
jgi:hypothetical protein